MRSTRSGPHRQRARRLTALAARALEVGAFVTSLAFVARTVGGQEATIRERSFPSDHGTVPSVHASTIAEVGGTMVAAWFGGAHEGAPDVRIWLSRRERGRWTPPREVADGGQPDGSRLPTWNPVLFAPGGERLVLFYKVGPSPRTWWGMTRESADGGRTWGAARALPTGILGPIRNKLVRLADGTLVSGSSTEGADSANAWRVHFERSIDGGGSWQVMRTATVTHGDTGAIDAIQPAILQHADGRLQALVRTRGPARIFETWSADGGKSWSALTPTTLPNPNAAIDAVTLRDGRQLLVYNPVTAGRTPLVVALSTDGRAWRTIATLESGPGEYSYPAVIQAADGTVHVTYTWRRERIAHVVLSLPAATAPGVP